MNTIGVPFSFAGETLGLEESINARELASQDEVAANEADIRRHELELSQAARGIAGVII